eukprot:jgi/Botrbrau1/19865/Bobra.0676s0001.1
MDESVLKDFERKCRVQSEPFNFQKRGPPLGVWADVSGATAQHINEIVLQGTEEIEFDWSLRVACSIFGADTAYIALINEDRSMPSNCVPSRR